MMMLRIKLPRFIRRAFHRSRVKRHLHEARLLTAEHESFQRRMDACLRDLRQAREDLYFVDVHRPPVSYAQGRPRGHIPRTQLMSDVLATRQTAPVTSIARRTFQRPGKTPKVAGEAS